MRGKPGDIALRVGKTGNKANGVAMGGTSGSAFPIACQGTP